MKHTRLSRQVSAVVVAAALVSALLAGLVALGLVRGAADTASRTVLRREAALVATLLDRPATAIQTMPGRPVARLLRQAGITYLHVNADGTVAERRAATGGPTLDAADLAASAAGQSISATRTLAGDRYLVEGAPISDGGGVVLLERTADARNASAPVVRRLLIALVLGLLAAVALGLLLARRLARPLVRAAAGARRLAAGERGLQLVPEGPREVADVTDALTQLAAALTASEGRQAQFLVSVSHELRTPLTAVRGFGEALADGVATGPEATHAGAVIVAESIRLQALVSDLLDLARLGADDFRLDLAEVDLTAVAAEAARVWEHRCAVEGVAFRLESPAAPTPVRTDAQRVRQILDGLLENALRATPAGRPLVLGLDARDPAYAVLVVRDGGPGLTEDDLAVAFERSALHDRYRGVRRVGTGVGLALVAGLAARLGGQVQAGHAPEGGASFAVRLPRPAG